jgi:hypothetical protein
VLETLYYTFARRVGNKSFPFQLRPSPLSVRRSNAAALTANAYCSSIQFFRFSVFQFFSLPAFDLFSFSAFQARNRISDPHGATNPGVRECYFEGAQMKPHKKARLAAVIFSVMAVAGVSFFCAAIWRSGVTHASPASELLSAVPSGAPTLVYIDLAELRGSSFYQHRPDHGPIAIPNSDYANFVQNTGFDFEKDLDRVLIASWPQSNGLAKKTMAFADGRFDRQKIRDYATKNGKIEKQSGRDVFLFQAKGKPGWNSLTFLDDHRIALLEGSSIDPLFAPRDAGAADPARERAQRVDGAAMFIISQVPAVPDNLGPGGPQSAQFAGLLRSLRWVTMAAQPDGDLLRVSLEGECKTPADARQMQSALEVLRMLGNAALTDPKSSKSLDPETRAMLETLIKNADVSNSGERVRLRLELGPEVLRWKQPFKSQAQQGTPQGQ